MAYGSLVNTLYDGDATDFASQVKVGDGATVLYYTDRRAATVVDVRNNGKTVTVQEDTATRTDGLGMTDAQTYEYTRNLDGRTMTFTLRKNGRYVRKGDTMRGGLAVRLGVRNHYHDYSF